jgi:cellulose synthase/poly-beta-1,6-N-acetylglucosamine synthase-like glycosyltransferase
VRSTFLSPTIESYLKVHPSDLRQTGGHGAEGKIIDPDLPLVSVFTIVRNNKDTLAQTIKSVIAQTYPNIEYLIVDGASTDGTLEIIKQFNDKIDFMVIFPRIKINTQVFIEVITQMMHGNIRIGRHSG